MNSVQEIFENVLTKILPKKQELSKIENIVSELKSLLDFRAKLLHIEYTKIEAQGSTGIKNTQLRGDYDIDLFIGLDYDKYKYDYEGYSKNKLKKELKKLFLKLCNNWIIKALGKEYFSEPRLLYAEHPYVTVYYILDKEQIKIDIVLYFDLTLKYIDAHGPITAVDRSPWHGRFIRDNLSLVQKNDVRLLKQFFKASHCYGDKSAVGKVGFIGYSAELLIFYYGDIFALFNEFNQLEKTPLDYFNRSKKELNDVIHFQNDYLIIIDPIDKNRNVASAISERAYKYCKNRIIKFLKEPKDDFFELRAIPEFDLTTLDENTFNNYYIVELSNISDEIHYTINRDKLYSLAESIKATGEKEYTHFERFGVIEFEVYFDDTINEYNIVFYVEFPEISKSYLRKGPLIHQEFHVNKFKKKNPNFIIKGDHLWVETKRDYTDFLSYLSEYVNENIPENFQINNISNAAAIQTSSAKKTLFILISMVLPFI